MRKFLERPPLKEKSRVAVVRAEDYAAAEKAVRRAVELLGGIGKIVKPGDKVMIKPNMIYATKPEEAETTHPAVVTAMVKLCKEAGASVKLASKPDGTATRNCRLSSPGSRTPRWRRARKRSSIGIPTNTLPCRSPIPVHTRA